MSSERPAKRIRQACEPCRRKKSRCPGEKPVCSHCSRLRQECYYADEPHRSDGFAAARPSVARSEAAGSPALEDRLRYVEAQLAEVVSNQVNASRSISRQISNGPSPIFQPSPAPRRPSRQGKSVLPSGSVVTAAAETYLLYCDCQPLPLFHRGSFIEIIETRDTELLFALLALTYRFSDNPELRSHNVDELVEASRAVVTQRVYEGTVELSTLQSLCLISLVDFTNGNTRRASMHTSLAISLAHNAELTSECRQNLTDVAREERRRCFWSLFLLKRLHGADFGIIDFTGEENFPWYPDSTGKPSKPDIASTSAHQALDRGIISCEIQLSEIWFKITKYARRRGKISSLPPWSPQSEYAVIMAQQMESETRMPHVHRFRPAEFPKKSIEELQGNRTYWGPWIFVQFIYHTNLCLLNHPLLLSLRLRSFKSEIPEMFLQSTADLITSHASWITHLIGMLEAKAFKITDPFLAHCAAIIATIYLQESFVEESRSEKMANFAICLKFVQGFVEWPHVIRMAEKLERLHQTVSSAYNNDPNRGLLIDLGQFWEILEYSSSSESPASASSLFGASLQQGVRSSTTEMAHTSSLPQPTRVDAQDFAGDTPPANPVLGALRAEDQAIQPFLYSDDELAVLAESFFHQQRPGMDGMHDWWNNGNL